jgi:DNA-directed RNA polymerase
VFGETLRNVYADTFRSDLLLNFKNEVEDNAGVTLPELPTYGTLETEDVRHSTYFFS